VSYLVVKMYVCVSDGVSTCLSCKIDSFGVSIFPYFPPEMLEEG
jgi:hypothetical protein